MSRLQTPDTEKLLGIGELGQRTGMAASALRYYEKIGLLSPVERVGGRRRYSASSAQRVAFIRLCREAGLTLGEIRGLLATGSRQAWREVAERKVGELDVRIVEAERAKALLQHAMGCPHADLLTCPSFRAALERHLNSVSQPPR